MFSWKKIFLGYALCGKSLATKGTKGEVVIGALVDSYEVRIGESLLECVSRTDLFQVCVILEFRESKAEKICLGSERKLIGSLQVSTVFLELYIVSLS